MYQITILLIEILADIMIDFDGRGFCLGLYWQHSVQGKKDPQKVNFLNYVTHMRN